VPLYHQAGSVGENWYFPSPQPQKRTHFCEKESIIDVVSDNPEVLMPVQCDLDGGPASWHKILFPALAA
jgi:hypothetical protein